MAEGLTVGTFIDSLGGMVARFAEVASVDPVSATMLASGAILVGFTVLVSGYLAAGAVVDAIVSLVPDAGGNGRPPGRGDEGHGGGH